jgi:Uma2 family endonuclease
MASPLRTARVTEAEFLALPESNDKIELVDGEVIMSPSPSYLHQLLSKRLVDRLTNWARESHSPCVVLYAPLDIRLAPDRIVQPDIVVFAQPLPQEIQTPVDVLPLLCAEILSANRAYDRLTKRYLYAQAGIPEYWCVDPAGEVERFTGAGLSMAERCTEHLTTPLLPGFDLDVRALLGA